MECNGCTLCCRVLPIPWMNKPPGVWCKHCDIGVGCKIWDDPVTDECKTFVCAYNQIENAPIELRPDKCKVIFEKVDNSIFLGTMHPHYLKAYKRKVIQEQIKIFSKRGFSIVFSSFTKEKPVIFPARGKKASEVWASLRTQVKEKHDSTIIHN